MCNPGQHKGPLFVYEDVYPSILLATTSQEWPNSSMLQTQLYFCLLAVYTTTELLSDSTSDAFSLLIPSNLSFTIV